MMYSPVRIVALTALLLLFASLMWPASGRAEPQLVGILSIETKGVSEVAAEQFEAEVEEALDGVGMQSVGRAALREKLDGSLYMEGCLFGPCLATLRGTTGVPIVLVANIQGNGSSYNFVVTLIDTKTGVPISQVAQNCAVCTIEEAISTATLTTISVLTGTGDAKSSADIEPVATADVAASPSPGPGALRRSGLIFLGAGAIGILAGVYVLSEQDRDIGLITLSSGAGLLTGGATMLLLSRRF